MSRAEERMGGYRYNPAGPVINIPDTRLNHIFIRDPLSCASLSEYATTAGMDTSEVAMGLNQYLDDGTLALETAGGEVFVLTAPRGRPQADGDTQVAPNLWELLRRRADTETAGRLWVLLRGLEFAGWKVEINPARVMFSLGSMMDPPILGVDVGNVVVPVLAYPHVDLLQDGDGPLSHYDRAGAGAVAVVCKEMALDETVTAVRKWILAHRPDFLTMSVLVLEAPRFDPTLLSPGDGVVNARAVTRQTLSSMDWHR